MPEIIIRKPLPDEYGQMAAVVDSELELYRPILPPDVLRRIGIGNFDPSYFADQKRLHYVAIYEGRVIGIVSWYVKPNGVLWVSMLHVRPEWHRRSVGSKLLAVVEDKASQLGCQAVALEVQKLATWAVAFYESKGYVSLREADLAQPPFVDTLSKPLAERSAIFGKVV